MKRFLVIALVCIPVTAFAQMPPPPGSMPRMLSVSGEAHMEIAPDQAVLNVSVVSRNQELNPAKQANDKLTKTVTDIALGLGIKKDKIATSNLYVSPEYDYVNGRQQLKDYIINRSLRITMDTMDVHERLLSQVIAAGVDQVGGVEFKLADPESVDQKLRAEAVKNAYARAKVLADTAGVELGKPISIATGGAAPIVQPMPMMAKTMDVVQEASSSVAPSLPGMITLQQSVSIVYEIK